MWAQLASALCGVWLMVAPALLGYAGVPAANHRIVGPLVASFAVIAMAQETRPTRWLNVPLGLWLMLSPLLLAYGDSAYFNGMVAGLLIMGLSLIKGKVNSRFGGGWSAIWRHSGFPPDNS